MSQGMSYDMPYVISGMSCHVMSCYAMSCRNVQGLVMLPSKWRGWPFTDPLTKNLVVKKVNYFTLSNYSTSQSRLFILDFS